MLFFEFFICYWFFIKCFFTDGQTHVQLKCIVRNLTKKNKLKKMRRTDTRSSQKYSSVTHKKIFVLLYISENIFCWCNLIHFLCKCFFRDGQTHVQLKTIVRNLTKTFQSECKTFKDITLLNWFASFHIRCLNSFRNISKFMVRVRVKFQNVLVEWLELCPRSSSL